MYSMVITFSTNPDFFLLMKSRLPKMKAYPPRLFLTRSTPSAVELTITSSPRLSMYSFILWYVGSYKYAMAVNEKNSWYNKPINIIHTNTFFITFYLRLKKEIERCSTCYCPILYISLSWQFIGSLSWGWLQYMNKI